MNLIVFLFRTAKLTFFYKSYQQNEKLRYKNLFRRFKKINFENSFKTKTFETVFIRIYRRNQILKININ